MQRRDILKNIVNVSAAGRKAIAAKIEAIPTPPQPPQLSAPGRRRLPAQPRIELAKIPPVLQKLKRMGVPKKSAEKMSDAYRMGSQRIVTATKVELKEFWATLARRNLQKIEEATKKFNLFASVLAQRLAEALDARYQQVISIAQDHLALHPPAPKPKWDSRWVPLFVWVFTSPNGLGKYPTQDQKQLLADKTKLSYRQIAVWFQNRRARTKKRIAEGKPVPPDRPERTPHWMDDLEPEERRTVISRILHQRDGRRPCLRKWREDKLRNEYLTGTRVNALDHFTVPDYSFPAPMEMPVYEIPVFEEPAWPRGTVTADAGFFPVGKDELAMFYDEFKTLSISIPRQDADIASLVENYNGLDLDQLAVNTPELASTPVLNTPSPSTRSTSVATPNPLTDPPRSREESREILRRGVGKIPLSRESNRGIRRPHPPMAPPPAPPKRATCRIVFDNKSRKMKSLPRTQEAPVRDVPMIEPSIPTTPQDGAEASDSVAEEATSDYSEQDYTSTPEYLEDLFLDIVDMPIFEDDADSTMSEEAETAMLEEIYATIDMDLPDLSSEGRSHVTDDHLAEVEQFAEYDAVFNEEGHHIEEQHAGSALHVESPAPPRPVSGSSRSQSGKDKKSRAQKSTTVTKRPKDVLKPKKKRSRTTKTMSFELVDLVSQSADIDLSNLSSMTPNLKHFSYGPEDVIMPPCLSPPPGFDYFNPHTADADLEDALCQMGMTLPTSIYAPPAYTEPSLSHQPFEDLSLGVDSVIVGYKDASEFSDTWTQNFYTLQSTLNNATAFQEPLVPSDNDVGLDVSRPPFGQLDDFALDLLSEKLAEETYSPQLLPATITPVVSNDNSLPAILTEDDLIWDEEEPSVPSVLPACSLSQPQDFSLPVAFNSTQALDVICPASAQIVDKQTFNLQPHLPSSLQSEPIGIGSAQPERENHLTTILNWVASLPKSLISTLGEASLTFGSVASDYNAESLLSSLSTLPISFPSDSFDSLPEELCPSYDPTTDPAILLESSPQYWGSTPAPFPYLW